MPGQIAFRHDYELQIIRLIKSGPRPSSDGNWRLALFQPAYFHAIIRGESKCARSSHNDPLPDGLGGLPSYIWSRDRKELVPMRPWTAWLPRLVIAAACVITLGCGSGGVPDPSSDPQAAAESASPSVVGGGARGGSSSTTGGRHRGHAGHTWGRRAGVRGDRRRGRVRETRKLPTNRGRFSDCRDARARD